MFPWTDVKNLPILHETNFHFIVISFISIAFLLSLCTQRNDSSSEKVESQKSSETSLIVQDIAPAKSLAAISPNPKSSTGKTEFYDSLKITRAKKTAPKPRQLAEKTADTDSQHTELINIPLGKASESSAGVSKLTAPEEQKHVEKNGGKKIQFADKIIKSTISTKSKHGKKNTKSQK